MRSLRHESQVSSLLIGFHLINFSDLITIITAEQSFFNMNIFYDFMLTLINVAIYLQLSYFLNFVIFIKLRSTGPIADNSLLILKWSSCGVFEYSHYYYIIITDEGCFPLGQIFAKFHMIVKPNFSSQVNSK